MKKASRTQNSRSIPQEADALLAELHLPSESGTKPSAAPVGEIRFGSVLKEYRSRARFSQQALADIMGVSRNTVINWENDKNKPEYDVLPKLCSVLGLTLGTLFGTDSADRLSPPEQRLLGNFRQLSPIGKSVVAKMTAAMLDEEFRAKDMLMAASFRVFAEYDSAAAAESGCEFSDHAPAPLILRLNGRNDCADAVVHVSGDSMLPAYRDGDLLYFRYADTAEYGADVVCSMGRSAAVRRVGNDGRLYSVNSALPCDLNTEADNCRIIGIVTGIVAPKDIPEQADDALLRDIFHDELAAFREKYGLSD